MAIRAMGLGKQYRIGRRETYRALRDVLTDHIQGAGRLLRSLYRGSSDSPRSSDLIWAVRDVSFEVRRGELLGVIGGNGAGKSTLLKLLSRITQPSEGTAEIRGHVSSLLEVGTGFHPELTGRENIYLSGAIHGLRRVDIARRFDEIVAFADVGDFIETPVKRYSSGMHLRLAFAVAAHLEPEILLVDEVLAVGDVSFQEKCLGKLRTVGDEGRTAIFVSHNLSAISSLCQRVLWLDRGHLREDTSAALGVAHYLASVRGHQQSSDGIISLGNHPGRRKQLDGPVKLTACSLLDAQGQSSSHFTCGDTLQLQVSLDHQDAGAGAHVSILLILGTSLGDRLAYLASDALLPSDSILSRTGDVVCAIPRLPVCPGSYTLSVLCRVAGQWSDVVYDAVAFDVVAGPAFGSRTLSPEELRGVFVIDHEWRVMEGAPALAAHPPSRRDLHFGTVTETREGHP